MNLRILLFLIVAPLLCGRALAEDMPGGPPNTDDTPRVAMPQSDAVSPDDGGLPSGDAAMSEPPDDAVTPQPPDNTGATATASGANVPETLNAAGAAKPSADTVIYRAPAPDCTGMRISGIEIFGNVTMRPEVLRTFFRFGVGDSLDLSGLRETRDDLLRTQLYKKVDIFPRIREDGSLHIFIVLEEAVRLQFGYGASYYTRKYGESDLWYSFSADATIYNFRGRLEELYFGGSVWDSRSFFWEWHKPFLPTPYYMQAGAFISGYPDEALPEDYMDISAQATAGRNIGKRSRVSFTATPIYRHRTIAEDKLRSEHDISFPGRNSFYEAFGAVNLINDYRSGRFDPRSGWRLNSELLTNRLYNGVNTPFFQLRNELRFYHRLLFGDDVAAFRFQLTLRDTDAGSYHRLTCGSTGTLRGYPEKALGFNFVSNSSILASIKYHKPVWESPPIPVPLIDRVYSNVTALSYRIDATLIADYARLYEDPLGALKFAKRRQDGVGLGFGTRFVLPDIRMSGCMDVVWGHRERRAVIEENVIRGGKEIVEAREISDGFEWKPMLHLYLDLFY